MGPAGSVSGPQYFPSTTSTGQIIPAATSSTSPGTLDSTLTVPSYDGTFTIADITVELNAAFSPDSDLTAVLIAPDGTQVTLFSGVGGNGSNFVNTVFDDSAREFDHHGHGPLHGDVSAHGIALDPGRPHGRHPEPLDPACGSPASGRSSSPTPSTGATGMLDNWSLNITPVITVTPVSPVERDRDHVHDRLPAPAAQRHLHDPARPQHPRHVRRRAGYQPERGPGRAAGHGSEQPDDHRPVHRGRPAQADPGAAADDAGHGELHHHRARQFHHPGRHDDGGGQRMQVQLNLTYPTDPDLTATLTHYDPSGNLLGSVTLFSGVGSGSTTANFTNTVFDDNAATPIQNGSAPFFCHVQPAGVAGHRVRAGRWHERAGDLDVDHHEQLDDGGHRARSTAGR